MSEYRYSTLLARCEVQFNKLELEEIRLVYKNDPLVLFLCDRLEDREGIGS